jgi:carbonic anhydrase
MSVKELSTSYSHFKENGDEEIKIKLNKLTHKKQNPSILFTACIDNRIDSSMFFGEN